MQSTELRWWVCMWVVCSVVYSSNRFVCGFCWDGERKKIGFLLFVTLLERKTLRFLNYSFLDFDAVQNGFISLHVIRGTFFLLLLWWPNAFQCLSFYYIKVPNCSFNFFFFLSLLFRAILKRMSARTKYQF